MFRKVHLALQKGKNSSGNLQEIFKTSLIQIKFTRGSPEALPLKIGVPIDKISRNRQKIPVKELIFINFTN